MIIEGTRPILSEMMPKIGRPAPLPMASATTRSDAPASRPVRAIFEKSAAESCSGATFAITPIIMRPAKAAKAYMIQRL